MFPWPALRTILRLIERKDPSQSSSSRQARWKEADFKKKTLHLSGVILEGIAVVYHSKTGDLQVEDFVCNLEW